MNVIVDIARTLSNTRVFGRHFAPNPSVDLYFRNAMAPQIRRFGRDRRPVRALGPTLFICNQRAVLIRSAADADLAALRKIRAAAVYYVLDDLLLRDGGDEGLPADYATRCRAFAQERLPRILEHATQLVTPNPHIADQLAELDSAIISPAFSSICRDFGHFDDVSRSLRLVFSGTRSHLNDLRSIATPLRGLLLADPGIHLTTFLGDHAPETLTGLRNVEHRRPLPWTLYKRVLREERFHLAISPTLDTAFNRARSASKLLDHAALGAASIFSDIDPFRQLTSHGENALLCQYPADWADAIGSLRRDPSRLRSLAMAGANLARSLGDPRHQVAFWGNRLALHSCVGPSLLPSV